MIPPRIGRKWNGSLATPHWGFKPLPMFGGYPLPREQACRLRTPNTEPPAPSKCPNRPRIARDNLVGGQQREPFDLRLSDEDLIEGVLVYPDAHAGLDRRESLAYIAM